MKIYSQKHKSMKSIKPRFDAIKNWGNWLNDGDDWLEEITIMIDEVKMKRNSTAIKVSIMVKIGQIMMRIKKRLS